MSSYLAYILILVVVLIGFGAILRGSWFAEQSWHADLLRTWPWWLAAILCAWGVALALRLMAPQPAQPAPGWMRADNMNGIYLTQGWGSPGFGHSVGGQPLTIGSEHFQNGIGTHAPGVIRLAVPAGAVEFGAQVGLDAEVTGGLVEFSVVADDETVWKSGPVDSTKPAQTVRVPVTGRHVLKLVTDALGSNDQDHADWVNPAFRIDPQAATATK